MGLFGRKKEKEPSEDELIEKAESGDVRAIVELGLKYQDDEDYSNAVVWFKKGVEKGDTEAQFNLAILYKQGWGVKQSTAKYYELLEASAEQGFKDAIEEQSL